MHIFPTKLKMKSAFFLHKDSVTFVMLHLYITKFNKQKKLESSFSALHHDIIFVKEAEWKPCDVSHHYIRANCGLEIDANLESTEHFEQQKNPLACRSFSVYLYLLMKTRLAYSSLFI